MKYDSNQMEILINEVKNECKNIIDDLDSITNKALVKITEANNWNADAKSSYLNVSSGVKQTYLSLVSVCSNICDYLDTVNKNYNRTSGGGGAKATHVTIN